MCDTQVLIQDGITWFAKNSDREPSEAQLVVRLPAARGDSKKTVQATHLSIEQVPDRFAVILSKPFWMWGAEMGANDQGVVIGNEAIFSRVMDRSNGLLGMDLVRLGLERGATARAALDVITGLLECHGQGGPAGFRNKRFHYDNSFLIADHREAWILETANRHWAAKRVQGLAAISNCMSIQADYDLHSEGLHEFARKRRAWNGRGDLNFARSFDTHVMPHFARAHERRELSMACLAEAVRAPVSFARMFSHLRRHAQGDDPVKGSNGDICLHAMGYIRRSQTTGSMVSRLAAGDTRHFLTGTSAPCVSLFHPVGFESELDYSVLSDEEDGAEKSLWRLYEPIHRRTLFNAKFRSVLREDRDKSEEKILELCGNARPPDTAQLMEADDLARDWMQRQIYRSDVLLLRPTQGRGSLYWRWLNRLDGFIDVMPGQ